MELKQYIIDVNNFPQPGIIFKDITPLLANGEAFNYVIDQMSDEINKLDADVIVGPESRGFIFATPVATKLNKGFVPVRKPNKLPREIISQTYDLEYGSNTLEIHKDAIKPGQKVVIVDDVLATGGTIQASIKMIEELGARVVGCVFLIHLKDLQGLEKLKDYNVSCLLEY